MERTDRVILHIDANSYYASVELLYRPDLRNKPVAVAGDTEQRHGIILAKNQIAKRYGVSTGEAIWQAKQKCRELITLPAHYDLYIQFSKALHEIYGRYTDQTEPYGLDEVWADMTGSTGLFGTGRQIADELRAVVQKELGITVSVGVSWNKIYAKLGSDYRKPDATTEFTRENYKNLVWPLPASDLLYVGRKTAKKLSGWGIHTIGQLAEANTEMLHYQLGKIGEILQCFAGGHDVSPVMRQGYQSAIKSIGNSMTTHRDIESIEEAWQVLLALSESVAQRLRENGFYCRTIEVNYRDNRLFWFEHQAKLELPVCTVEAIAEAAMRLLTKHFSFSVPLRSLGVRACDLVESSVGYQLSLFTNTARLEKRERLETAVDDLRQRFGGSSVVRAALVGADIIGESDPLTHAVHPLGYFGR